MRSAKLGCRCHPEWNTGAGILKASGGNVDHALQRYNRERLPDVKALLSLNQLWAARMGIRAEVGAWRHACTRYIIIWTLLSSSAGGCCGARELLVSDYAAECCVQLLACMAGTTWDIHGSLCA